MGRGPGPRSASVGAPGSSSGVWPIGRSPEIALSSDAVLAARSSSNPGSNGSMLANWVVEGAAPPDAAVATAADVVPGGDAGPADGGVTVGEGGASADVEFVGAAAGTLNADDGAVPLALAVLCWLGPRGVDTPGVQNCAGCAADPLFACCLMDAAAAAAPTAGAIGRGGALAAGGGAAGGTGRAEGTEGAAPGFTVGRAPGVLLPVRLEGTADSEPRGLAPVGVAVVAGVPGAPGVFAALETREDAAVPEAASDRVVPVSAVEAEAGFDLPSLGAGVSAFVVTVSDKPGGLGSFCVPPELVAVPVERDGRAGADGVGADVRDRASAGGGSTSPDSANPLSWARDASNSAMSNSDVLLVEGLDADPLGSPVLRGCSTELDGALPGKCSDSASNSSPGSSGRGSRGSDSLDERLRAETDRRESENGEASSSAASRSSGSFGVAGRCAAAAVEPPDLEAALPRAAGGDAGLAGGPTSSGCSTGRSVSGSNSGRDAASFITSLVASSSASGDIPLRVRPSRADGLSFLQAVRNHSQAGPTVDRDPRCFI
jgi:hypothetical protein